MTIPQAALDAVVSESAGRISSSTAREVLETALPLLAKHLTRDLNEARAEASRLRKLLTDVVIPEFREQIEFVRVECPEAVGTPPHIRKLIRLVEAHLAVPFSESFAATAAAEASYPYAPAAEPVAEVEGASTDA